jgi:hypothetical protein
MFLDEESDEGVLAKQASDPAPDFDLLPGEVMSDADRAAAQEALLDKMVVGTWVELLSNGVWSRTQLGWISLQRSTYLFTSVQGKIQSMTKRSLLRLMALQKLRLLAERSVVDGALDAIVHTATLNSLDLRFD